MPGWRSRWTVPVLVAGLLACGDGTPRQPLSPGEPLPPAPGSPAAIALVSGDGQEGKAGERLAEAFVVRVTDEAGAGVEGVEVAWRITAGEGSVRSGQVRTIASATTTTDADGLAEVSFIPTALGPSTVSAVVPGSPSGSSVTFRADATGLVIGIGGNWDFKGDWRSRNFGWGNLFMGPDGAEDTTVPVGTTVEWVNWIAEATVTSTTVPPGGASFDSGTLSAEDRFRFVPRVAGTWEYTDEVTGEPGTLTAR